MSLSLYLNRLTDSYTKTCLVLFFHYKKKRLLLSFLTLCALCQTSMAVQPVTATEGLPSLSLSLSLSLSVQGLGPGVTGYLVRLTHNAWFTLQWQVLRSEAPLHAQGWSLARIIYCRKGGNWRVADPAFILSAGDFLMPLDVFIIPLWRRCCLSRPPPPPPGLWLSVKVQVLQVRPLRYPFSVVMQA